MIGNASRSRFVQRGSTNPAYYGGERGQASGAELTVALGTMYFIPFEPGAGGLVDEAWFEVTTGVATAVGRMGLYRSTAPRTWNASSWSLIADFGEKDCAAAAVKLYTAMSVTVPPDILCCYVLLFGTAACGIRVIHSSVTPPRFGQVSGTYRGQGLGTAAQAYGALPASKSISSSSTGNPPMGKIRWA